MVNPEKITKYNLSDRQLEEYALFWICAAGKNGRTAAKCLHKLLQITEADFYGPLNSIHRAHKTRDLPELMKSCGIGCYNSKAKSFTELSYAVLTGKLDLRTCSADDLEKIHGIGMKTSRCFIMHSRKGARYAGLDTHILKYLRACSVENVPKSTPSSKKEYLRLEQEFLKLADFNKMEPADLDLVVWNQYSVKSTVRT
jgi:thermostable 8-oxoguanine DNA glycosylase